MGRPTGVVASCIVLGFFAFALLMMAFGALIVIPLMSHMPMPVPVGQPAPNPAMMSSVMRIGLIASAVFYAALAIWATVTIVGLARLKNWARYSIIVIGGGLAMIGVLAALGSIMMAVFMPATATAQGQNPVFLRVGLIIASLFYLGMASVGIWWLVYFLRHRTRDLFAVGASLQMRPAIAYPPAPPSPYGAASYQVADYIPPPDLTAPPAYAPVPEQQIVAVPPPPARPLAITVIGWLLIAAAVILLLCALLPFPMFLFGMMLTGWKAHIFLICSAIVYGLAGVGLLQLRKMALYVAYASYTFGALNSLVMLIPGFRDRMVAYQHDLTLKMGMPTSPVFDDHTMALLMLPGIFMAVVFCVIAIVFLFRDRAAFDPPQDAAA